MKLLIATAILLSVSYSVNASASTSVQANSYLENVLIKVCKASKTNSLLTYHNTLKRYRLKNKTVAQQVVCNGQDIASFARSNGAHQVAKKIERSINKTTSITDIASVDKLSVRFE
ncbi:DUF3718 domain-containing protein [Thalassotalea marina]|uniref:DUF3718 domain-containing protein n=1 Tax=Thalassotalea marina TaxID=1673741 RepID=A0A919BEW1_9GAMM|nr:DUF3718 domain-containing protein [Thalassotalea marina]GHF84014.1 hypothetical protein GCM10017161_09230 [Thalassotalea marina]